MTKHGRVECKWYAEPQGDVAHANRVIAGVLREEVAGPSFCGDTLFADGKKHNAWILPCYKTAQQLWASRGELRIRIKIWCKKGGGQVRDVTLLFNKKRKRAKK